MINLNDIKYEKITKEDLFKKFSEYDIFRYYIGDFELGQTYCSPLRRDDKIPSFNIFHSNRHGCLLFKDFAGKRGDCIILVQELYSLCSYQDAINRIYHDMSLGNSISIDPKITTHKSIKLEYELKIVSRNWQIRDANFWTQFHISKPTLIRYNVIPIKGYYHNDRYIETKDIAYAYLEYKDNNLTYKIYRPLADKTKKWRNNNPFGVHQGYRQLANSGDLMIITKSLKDVMAIWENVSIPTIAVQSETCFIKDTVVDEYKFRFDRVLTLFDNDRQGKEQADSYQKLYDIYPIFIPEQYGVKDFSDLIKQVGISKAIQILKDLL